MVMLYKVLTVAAATLASVTGALASDTLDARLAQLDAKVHALEVDFGSKAYFKQQTKSKPEEAATADDEAEAARYRAKLALAKKKKAPGKWRGKNFAAAEKIAMEEDSGLGFQSLLYCVCDTDPDISSVPACAPDVPAGYSETYQSFADCFVQQYGEEPDKATSGWDWKAWEELRYYGEKMFQSMNLNILVMNGLDHNMRPKDFGRIGAYVRDKYGFN